MRIVSKPLHWFYCAYALLTFVAGMLVVVPFVTVFSFWGQPRGGNLIYQACRCWDDAWLWLVGIRPVNLPEHLPGTGQQYVFIANHISYMDIPLILQAVRRHPIRVLGKAEARKIPIFGYIYSRAVVMVDRSSAIQRAKSLGELRTALRQGLSVFIFPEGTFNETLRPLKDFYDGAFRIAIETQTPVKPLLFLDSFERMHYSSIFSLDPGPSRALFLPEISVAGYSLDDLPRLREDAYHAMEAELVRRHAAWIGEKKARPFPK